METNVIKCIPHVELKPRSQNKHTGKNGSCLISSYPWNFIWNYPKMLIPV